MLMYSQDTYINNAQVYGHNGFSSITECQVIHVSSVDTCNLIQGFGIW